MSRAANRWRRGLPWILLACFVAGSAMALYTLRPRTPVYSAVYTFYALPAEGEDAQALARQLSHTLETRGAERCTVQSVDRTHMLKVTVVDPDAQSACETANRLGKELSSEASAVFGAKLVREIEEAALPQTPIGQKRVGKMLASILIPFVLGSLISLLVRERTIASDEPQAKAMRLGKVGRLGYETRQYLRKSAREPQNGMLLGSVSRLMQEGIRALSLLLRISSNPWRSLVVTAPSPGEADGALAALLASEMAQQGFRVLLVETEAEGSQLGLLAGASARADLPDYLSGRAKWTDVVTSTPLKTLFFVDWQHSDEAVTTFAATEVFADFMHSAQEHFDYVLVHAAPMKDSSEAAMLSLVADGTILVARERAYTLEELETAAGCLSRLGRPAKGVVFTED